MAKRDSIKKGVVTLDLRFYGDYADNWDDLLFRNVILNRVRDSDCILEIGAGIGFVKEMHFRGMVARVCGLDPGASVLNNPHLDEGRVGFGEEIPWPDEAFDLVFADNVLEHLRDPDAVFREVNRVLKPGGHFLVKTPNRFHYVALIAQATPSSFHKLFNKFRGRDDSHTFKTYYRANSKGQIMRLAKRTGLSVCEIQRIEGRPEYLRFSTFTYLLGLLYERTVNKFDVLSPYRILLVGIFQKPFKELAQHPEVNS